MYKVFLFLSLLFISSITKAQPGFPDPSFGKNGAILSELPAGDITSSETHAAMVQPDGRILLVIKSVPNTRLAMYLSDGTRDISYGRNGFSECTSLFVEAAAQQADGKVVVAGTKDGSARWMLARYNIDGTVDQTFGNKGIVITDVGGNLQILSSIVLTSQGRIIAAGQSEDLGTGGYGALAAYTSDGTLDLSFGNKGIVHFSPYGNFCAFNAVALQANGNIVAGGIVGLNNGDFILAGFNVNGQPDYSFNGTGYTTMDIGFNDHVRALAVNSAGDIYAGGESSDDMGNTRFTVARFAPGGLADLSFNGSGFNVAAFGTGSAFLTSVALQQDGRLLAAGHTNLNPENWNVELLRFNTNGTLDNSFGTNDDGRVIADVVKGYDQASFLAIQADEKILTGGLTISPSDNATEHYSCLRFSAGGIADASFGTGGYVDAFVPGVFFGYYALTTLANGKLLAESYLNTGAADLPRSYLSRIEINGDYDANFGSNGVKELPSAFERVKFLSSGKLLAIKSVSGVVTLSLFNTDGSPDPAFGQGGTASTNFGGVTAITNVIEMPNGKIVGGGLSRNNNGSDFFFARFNADGTLDQTFGTNGTLIINAKNEENVQALALGPDGKIVFGGTTVEFPSDFSYLHFYSLVGRLTADGEPDASFGTGGLVTIDRREYDYILNMVVQDDGKVLFTHIAGDLITNQLTYLTRINADGTIDNAFGEDGDIVTQGILVALQADQKIIIGGSKINDQNLFNAIITRYTADGFPDGTFGNNGETTSSFSGYTDGFNTIHISGNSLFAAGSSTDNYGKAYKLIAKYQLENITTLSCPGNHAINNDLEKCSAVVNNIDPLDADVNLVHYTLSGATTASGTGSASGLTFNEGVTTVSYALQNDASIQCNFSVTVTDTQDPRINDLKASETTLWPPNHNFQDISLSYMATDNCQLGGTTVSITSNEPEQSGVGADRSPDWEIIDAHHIRLRAERLSNGNGRVYTVTVTATDESGNQSKANVNVYVPRSLLRNLGILSVKVSPNPSTNHFTVIIRGDGDEKIDVRVEDVGGVVMEEIRNIQPFQVLKVGKKLKPGTYFLIVTQGDIIKTLTLVKQ